MKKYRVPAVVFGGGINGLGIVRNLGRAGIRVYCVTESFDSASFSNQCYRRILMPHYAGKSGLVKSFLLDLSRKTSSRPVIFATDDIGTLMLSALADSMGNDCRFIMPEKKVAETLVVKSKFYASLEEMSISHPRVLIPNRFTSMKELKKELRYPVFIRPSISPEFARVFNKKGFVATTEREVDYYSNLASKHKIEIIFQEIVLGPDTNLYGIAGVFGKKGEPLALFGYHRLRGWPVMFGNNSLMESVALSDMQGLKGILVNYLRNLGYYGIMEAEFKKDIRDDKFRLLEVNARSWWQNSFATKCGQNIVLKAYLDAVGERIEYNEKYATSIKWIDVAGDLRSSIQSGEVLRRRWFRSLMNIRDNAFFDVDDTMPFFARPFCTAYRLLP